MGKTERFSSRWGLLFASLGMAVGAGNIWRFPRVASQHGGGAFMIAWLVALFAWSIPLLIVEFWWGRSTRRGPVGAFVSMAGPGWAWAGGFVAICCTAIMFYYAVVSGWCLYYLGRSVFMGLEGAAVQSTWDAFVGSGWTVVCLAAALAIAVLVVLFGVRRGIERVSKVLVPCLFVLLLAAAVRAVMLPGAEKGLERLFQPNFHLLLEHKVWIEAFSQSAWSTGAGWGLLLVYSGYARRGEEVVVNSFITGLGNNAASLLAAIAIVPTVFALLPPDQASQVAAAGNEGLAFIWMPRLFLCDRNPGGAFLLIVFFASLALAALSSLIAMVEMGVRSLVDLGMARRTAVAVVALAGFTLGLPSALWMEVFKNQDWVWGLGLLVSGFLFAMGAARHGLGKMRREHNAEARGPGLGIWFELCVRALIPVAFLVMLVWWFWQAISWNPESWIDPRATTGLSTCLLQWGLVLVGLGFANRWLRKRSEKSGGPQ
ncbi:MAG: sodium-dependent transporter [Deltaproteobacteria bacterium]|nr:sodium-dependent transporter [Deltaproteobacteria bacterium]